MNLIQAKEIEKIANDPEHFNVFLDDLEEQARNKQNFNLLLRIQKARGAHQTLNLSRKMCLEYLTASI